MTRIRSGSGKGRPKIPYQTVSSNSAVSTTSSTWQGIIDTSITLDLSGTYIAIFTASTELDGANGEGEIRLELDGSLIDTSAVRELSININLSGVITLDTSDLAAESSIVTVFSGTAGQVIRPAYRELNNDVMFVGERNLTIVRLDS